MTRTEEEEAALISLQMISILTFQIILHKTVSLAGKDISRKYDYI